MKKRILSLVCVIVLLVSMLSACGKKETPKELLTKALENSYEMKTAKQDLSMSLNVNLDSLPDDEGKMFLEMINNAKLTGSMESDIEKIISKGLFKLELSGMAYDVEFYGNGYESIVKVPMFPKYIVTNSQINPEEEIDKEEIKKFSKKISETLLNAIKDDSITIEEKQTVVVNGKDESVTKIVFSLKDQEMKTFIKDVITKMIEDEYFANNVLKSNIKTQMEVSGEEFTEEKYKEKLQEMKTEIETGFAEMDKAMSFDSFDVVYGLDKSNNVIYSDVSVSLTMKDEEQGMNVPLTVNVNSSIWDINKPIEIVLPVLDENNSISYEDMMLNPYGMDDQIEETEAQ